MTRDELIEAMARANCDWWKCSLATQAKWRDMAAAALSTIEAAGVALVPVEPTDEMLAASLQSSLDMMAEHGVDALSPFKDYPRPAEISRRAYTAMVSASPLAKTQP